MSKQMTGKETARCENDAVTSISSLKRKSEPEMSNLCSKERKLPDDANPSIEFNDMCDDVIDLILCHLRLEDLANIADTSTRLRSIAGSIFSRKHSHRVISIDAFYYARIVKRFHGSNEDMTFFCKPKAVVRIKDSKIWFKLMRNFGPSIKYIRIQGCDIREHGTYILSATKNVMKYVSEFCSDSLNVLELVNYPFCTLDRQLTNLQEFFFINEPFDHWEALDLMPNLRYLRASYIPRTLGKHYAKLEKVHLVLSNDREVEWFIAFLRENRQIRYLKICVGPEFRPEHNDLIYTSIAENLTQLTTLKIYESNEPTVFSTYRFKTVESFSFRGSRKFSFEFTNLKRLELDFWTNKSLDWLNFIPRNKGLEILKLVYVPQTWLKESTIRNLISELTELKQIIFDSTLSKEKYSVLKNMLGREWKQFENKKSPFKLGHEFPNKCFQKIHDKKND